MWEKVTQNFDFLFEWGKTYIILIFIYPFPISVQNTPLCGKLSFIVVIVPLFCHLRVIFMESRTLIDESWSLFLNIIIFWNKRFLNFALVAIYYSHLESNTPLLYYSDFRNGWSIPSKTSDVIHDFLFHCYFQCICIMSLLFISTFICIILILLVSRTHISRVFPKVSITGFDCINVKRFFIFVFTIILSRSASRKKLLPYQLNM